MTKRHMIVAFAAINLTFIGAQLYKHTRIVKLQYQQNAAQMKCHALDHEIETLRQQICAQKDTASIKQYAQQTLHMRPISLTDVRRLSL